MDSLDRPEFEVETGDLDLIKDGYVISHNIEPISITIDGDLVIEFEFIYNDSDTEIDTEVVSEKELRFKLYNHGGGVLMGGTSPPVGPQNPISIGTNRGRELLISYRVSTEYMDNEPSTVSLYYNFYLGEETTTSELEEKNDGD